MNREQDRESAAPIRIGRRDALKVLGAAPAAALVASAPAAALDHASGMAMPSARPPAAAPAGEYQPRALTAHEYRMLEILSELILPADEPACIDDWLTIRGERWLDEIRGGFLWLDVEARRHYGHDFAECTAGEHKELIDRIAWPDRATIEDANAAAFFSRLRDAVVSAFYSSKIGVADLGYLGNTMVAHWQGCPDTVLARLDLTYEQSQWRAPFPGRSKA